MGFGAPQGWRRRRLGGVIAGLLLSIALGCGGTADEVVIDIGPSQPPGTIEGPDLSTPGPPDRSGADRTVPAPTVDTSAATTSARPGPSVSVESTTTTTNTNTTTTNTTTTAARRTSTSIRAVTTRPPSDDAAPTTRPSSVSDATERRSGSNDPTGSGGSGDGAGGGSASDITPTLELRLVGLEIDDLQDGIIGRDEVSLLVIPVPDDAGQMIHLDLGKASVGPMTGVEQDLFSVIEPTGPVALQIAAIERDSDGFGELAALTLDGIERAVGDLTPFDLGSGEQRARTREQIQLLTLDQLTTDDGVLVNDHDLLGICWLVLDITARPSTAELDQGVDCAGEVSADGGSATMRFSGERGRWIVELAWN